MTSTPRESPAAAIRRQATTPATVDAITLRSPDALVSAIPYLIGFEPRDSGVLVWLSGGRIVLTQRLDLPGSLGDLPAWQEAAWSHAAANEADELIVVACARQSDLVADWAADVISEARARSVAVRDVLRVEGERWWSLLCSDASCCPKEGRRVESRVKDAVAAEFALLGRAPMPNRSAIAATLEPDPTRVTAVAMCLEHLTEPEASGVEAWRDAALRQLSQVVVAASPSPGADPSEDPSHTARLLEYLADIRVRDTLLWDLAQLDADGLASSLDRMIALLRSAPAGTVAPVATCCAVLAWLLGDGVRAMMAVERARADDPHYSLAALVGASLRAGLPPQAWREVMAALPREECRYGSR